MSKKIHRQRNDEKYKLKNEMLYRKMQTASFQPRLFSHLIYLKEQRFEELIEYLSKKRWNVIRKKKSFT